MKRFPLLLAAFLGLIFSAPAFAAPLSYYNQPFDTPNAATNALITQLNTYNPGFTSLVTCSGTTTSTCSGLRVGVSITGLTTAAGAVSAAMTVTNTSVTAASQILCAVNGYAGGGIPIAVTIIPAAGSFSFKIKNVDASAALDATVTTSCLVYN